MQHPAQLLLGKQGPQTLKAPRALAPRSQGRIAGRIVRPIKAQEKSLEDLRAENSVLKNTVTDTQQAVDALEQDISGAGLEPGFEALDGPTAVAAEAAGMSAGSMRRGGAANAATVPTCPEDYWTPGIEVVEGNEYQDRYGEVSPIPQHDGTECFKWDNMLWSAEAHFKYRWQVFKDIRAAIDANEGGLAKFSEGYKLMGFNRGLGVGLYEGKPGIWYREWAPGAKALALIGEFNNWSPRNEDWAVKNPFGTWELFIPDLPDGSSAIPHKSKIKCRLESAGGEWADKIPAWIKWATQDPGAIPFNGVYYEPPKGKGRPGEISSDHTYTFQHPRPPKPRALRIYECHVGMSSAEPKVNSYLEFRRDMLPRIRKLGYNAIQIMAIQEHAYYGSFGYHVTNFFGASSRFGTPDDLKALIDEAHRLGMVVLMDIVHSHASKNTMDGINMFDGTDGMYFHGGARGNHWMWDSRLFNYGNWETMRFLLSNARWWIDEYKFDGYRFDGVTSMMYHHHGLQYTFTGNYNEYFGLNTDVDAVVYLMLVNNLLHDVFPNSITIGEDVSGMPTLCRPWQEGGMGFDYRLQVPTRLLHLRQAHIHSHLICFPAHRNLISVPGENLQIMVNWLHAASHDFQCQLKNSGRYRTGAGWAVGEQAEQLWALTNAASGIIKYMTKPHRREFLEAVLEDINSMKQRALVLQLRTKWLSMCAKEKQLKQELSEIVNKARVAGVHNIQAAADAFHERTLSPTESDNQDAVSATYVRLREMHAGKQALAQINRDWSLAVSQPRSVGELLLKGSNRREVNGLELKLSSLEVRLGMTPTSTWQRSSQEYQAGLKTLAEQEVLRYQGAIDVLVQGLRASHAERLKGSETSAQLKNRRNRDKKKRNKISSLLQEMYMWIEEVGLHAPKLSGDQEAAMLRGEPAPWQFGSQFSGLDMYFGRQYFMASNDAKRCAEEMSKLPIEKQRLRIWVARMSARIREAKAALSISFPYAGAFHELTDAHGKAFWLDWHSRQMDAMTKEIDSKLHMV